MSTNSDSILELPPTLVDAVRKGNAILFLGAGASIGARHPKGAKIPVGNDLRDLLCDRFLEGALKDKSLAEVAQYCENEASRVDVQAYIRTLLKEFTPAQFHYLLPAFRWHAIVSTNYDLIIEGAYAGAQKPLQDIIPFYKNSQQIETEMKRAQRPVQYLKLHGCINHHQDAEAPLILTPEQYVKFRDKRSRLFNRLEDWAHEMPIIFCGYSVGDPNIQSVLFDLFNESIERPSYFTVQPHFDKIEERHWIKHRITPINATFEQFLSALDKKIPVNDRVLFSALPQEKSSLSLYYNVNSNEPESLVSFLKDDVIHVHAGMAITAQDPKLYYRGYDSGFGGIVADLDVRRSVSDTIIVDAILADEKDRKSNVDLFLIKGAAGNGKTTILKRIAWEAATEYEALVLWLKDAGALRCDMLNEISARTQKRLFIFIDRAATKVDEIQSALNFAKTRNIKLTVITAERDNEWNSRCEALENYTSESYPVHYFSETEIHKLLEKLEKHRALGLLAKHTYSERIVAFMERAKRQILVALHEATLGRPFEEIIADEYRRIIPEEAQVLYLDICSLHRYGVQVRAGLIARVSGIHFSDFEKRLFNPLQGIVFSVYDKYIGDRVFQTRHQHVAEIVFDQALTDPEDKLNQLIRILKGINIDYAVDQQAFRQIIRGKQIAASLDAIERGRAFYKAAHDIIGCDPYLFQQEGLFEINHKHGDLPRAEKLLFEAERLASYDRSIQHTIANLLRRKALNEPNSLLKRDLRQKALERLALLAQGGQRHPYEINTRLSILVDEIKEILPLDGSEPTDNISEKVWIEKMHSVENEFISAHQMYPNDEHILATEAEYRKAVHDHPRAVLALAKAFEVNPRMEWIAIRLSDLYEKTGVIEKAKQTLLKAITENPNAKQAHLRLGKLYIASKDKSEKALALAHFRSGFSNGDSNYEAQFWYARELFLIENYDEAEKYFSTLKNSPVPPSVRNDARGICTNDENEVRYFIGKIVKKEETYLFLRCTDLNKDIFAHISNSSADTWQDMLCADDVSFCLGFTFKGPVAINLIAANASMLLGKNVA